jgi:hypothetical protein
MPTSAKAKKIDQLMEDALKALEAGSYFTCERLSLQALTVSRESSDFLRIARILPALQEARRQRMQIAVDADDHVRVVTDPVLESAVIAPGCYLVQPPLVGADARRLRLMAFEQEVPVLVICREPMTKLKLCPIVAITPGSTVRTKIDPPDDPAAPDIPWLLGAMETLGEWAIASLDRELTPPRRVEALLTRLEAVPDHELLHQTAAEAAEAAHAALLAEQRQQAAALHSRQQSKESAVKAKPARPDSSRRAEGE